MLLLAFKVLRRIILVFLTRKEITKFACLDSLIQAESLNLHRVVVDLLGPAHGEHLVVSDLEDLVRAVLALKYDPFRKS